MKKCCNPKCRKEFDTPGCQCKECRDRVLRKSKPVSIHYEKQQRKLTQVGETLVLK